MINITKNQPAPACLASEKAKANGDYYCGDVLERNRKDFHNKCYICEFKWVTDINTEHFVPHRGDVDKKFDWNNLFFACARCNNIKSDRAEFDDILNCTEDSPLVEACISQECSPFPVSQPKFTALVASQTVANTITLLDDVFNGTTMKKKLESESLRRQLSKEISDFLKLTERFYYLEAENAVEIKPNEKAEVRAAILTEIQASSNFAAFKRMEVRKNPFLYTQFADTL